MNSVKIDKLKLMEIIVANKEKHIREYEESIIDFIKAVQIIIKKNLALAKAGTLEEIAKIKEIPSAPRSYETSYNKSISMLSLSVDVSVELDEREFSELVQDEWNWKNHFTVSNSVYKSFT